MLSERRLRVQADAQKEAFKVRTRPSSLFAGLCRQPDGEKGGEEGADVGAGRGLCAGQGAMAMQCEAKLQAGDFAEGEIEIVESTGPPSCSAA